MRAWYFVIGLVLICGLGCATLEDLSENENKIPTTADSEQRESYSAPRLTVDQIKQLRLPDVRFTSVAHYEENPDFRVNVAHVEVNALIGGVIGFRLFLPDEWNGRFVMGGGSGRFGNYMSFSVNRGYANAGKGAGNRFDERGEMWWMVNRGDSRHRRAEVAKAIIHAYYGIEPKYSYYGGCSGGGLGGLSLAQRYPEDFDGIIAAAPIVDLVGNIAARVYNAQHCFPDPNKLDQTIVTKNLLLQLHAKVLEKCDTLDGVKDGIIDDPRQCSFDLSQFEGLTATQQEALKAIYEGPRNENGQIYPGIPLGTEDQWFNFKIGSFPRILKQSGAPNTQFRSGMFFCKEQIFNDPNWDYSSYDFVNWEKDTQIARTFMNAVNPDLSKFKTHGGKLIIWHGWADGGVTALSSIAYFKEVEQRDPELRDYFRLYLLPGVKHCGGGVGPDQVDWLATLANWVEQGKAPHRLVASKHDKDGNVTMTRPIYPYPLRAIYKGSGSTNEAENFLLSE